MIKLENPNNIEYCDKNILQIRVYVNKKFMYDRFYVPYDGLKSLFKAIVYIINTSSTTNRRKQCISSITPKKVDPSTVKIRCVVLAVCGLAMRK